MQLVAWPLSGSLLLVLVLLAFSACRAEGQTNGGRQTATLSENQLISTASRAQDLPSIDTLEPGEDPANHLFIPLASHVLSDQKQFWTTPARLHMRDLRWVMPLAGTTGLLIASDSWISKQVPSKPSDLRWSRHVSDYAFFSLAGGSVGAYLWGHVTRNDLLSETGLLSGEAAINGTVVSYLFKAVTQRPRPVEGSGSGKFFQGGTSFPSEHSTIAWSVASVVAHEYPGPVTQIMAYGLASAVTLTRLTSKQHFNSDVVVGSALGWYFGRQIYRRHHDPELGGAPWGSVFESSEPQQRNPDNMGSPYVPLDSWVYGAFDRLIGRGYIQSAYLGIRPWTRMECARMLAEIDERMPEDDATDKNAHQTYEALQGEFVDEISRLNGAANIGISLDSVYTRGTEIAGRPLRDGYHFGQTVVNDYGRPYWRGFNNTSGISAHAVAGPLAFYIGGEYQHAPAVSSDPADVLQAITAADFTPTLSNAVPQVNRFATLNSMVAINLHNVQVSFGRQSGWLGPGESGSLLLSNDAQALTMLKIDSTTPYQIPLLSRVLGPARSEFFLGRLDGQQFEVISNTTVVGPDIHQQPYLHGEKISFKPTPNLELGFGLTAMFAGPELPFTWSNFLRTFYSHKATAAANPGKRTTSFDFTYRVPGLRKWLTVYSDSLAVDEISPLGSTRPTLNPGIYLPQLPKLPKMEFRAEGLQEPLTGATNSEFPAGFVYYDLRRYRSGYTNDGNLLGSWIGRAGRGGQAWLTYSVSPRTQFQLGYRHQEVSKDFIKGGRLIDYSGRAELMLSRNVAFSTYLQYEQWKFPVLASTRQSNVTASMQLTFYPHWQVHRSK
jgi:membrane-associated phospholipid phosphatase